MIRRLADLRIANKLGLGFSVICLLLLTVSSIGLVRLGEAQRNMTDLADSGLASVDAIDQTDTDLQIARFSLANIALAPDAAGTAKALEALDVAQKSLDERWASYLRTRRQHRGSAAGVHHRPRRLACGR